jgi:Icc-related predicted phosphoesterase
MKILAVGDIHGDYRKIINYLKNNKVDLIIITGDITQFGPAELGEEILNEISSFETPVLAIPGNCDPVSIHGKIENSQAVNIHGRSLIIKNIGICGFGGSNPTPFNTPLEFEEVEIYDQTSKLIKGISQEKISLLVTHTPPYNTKTDLLPSGMHAGSTSIRKIIEEYQPSLNVCGHIHESRGVDTIGKTKIVNPGEISQGHGCLIHINDEDQVKVEIIEL